MITIKDAKTFDGQVRTVVIPSSEEGEINAEGRLYLFPGLIDSHVCFGPLDKKNWHISVESEIRGGFSAVFEIPDRSLSCDTKKGLEQTKENVEKLLSDLHMPLRYQPYFCPDLQQVNEIGIAKELVQGIVIRLDPDKKEILHDQWERVFQLAAWEDLLVVIDLHNETHRSSERTLLAKAVEYAERQNTRLYILNVSTKEEIQLIQQARERGLLIHAETTAHHLFLKKNSNAHILWNAINDGTIEIIGSGFHADQKEDERLLFKGNFSFSDPRFLLPLMLTAYHEGKISLEKITSLTCLNVCDLFGIARNNDAVLVDLEKEHTVQKITNAHSTDTTLKGWPVCTIVNGCLYRYSR